MAYKQQGFALLTALLLSVNAAAQGNEGQKSPQVEHMVGYMYRHRTLTKGNL